MKVLGERMTEESYVTFSWNQPPVKFKAERQYRRRCIGEVCYPGKARAAVTRVAYAAFCFKECILFFIANLLRI